MKAGKRIDDVFRVHVLGIGNYFSEKHKTVSFIVQAGSTSILLEAPNDLPRRIVDYRKAVDARHLAEDADVSGLDLLCLDNIKDIVVTHVHGDHSAGLETLAWYNMFIRKDPLISKANWSVDRSRRPRVYGTRDVMFDLRSILEPTLTNKTNLRFEDFYDVVLVEPSDSCEIGDGGLKLSVCDADHGVASMGVRLSYKGKSVSYSGDTRFSPSLMGFLSQSDVMIHECDGDPAVHTSAKDLRDWVNSSGYEGQLYVCHFFDENEPDSQGLIPLKEDSFIDI